MMLKVGCVVNQIVEMGAGSGYWGKLLQLRGVDIVCYDLHVADEEEAEAEASDSKAQEGPKDAKDGSSEEEEEEEGSDGDEEQEEQDGEEEVEQEEDDNDDEVEVEQIFWTEVLKGTPKVRTMTFAPARYL